MPGLVETLASTPLDSPFSLRYVLGFGGILRFIVLAGAVAQVGFGAGGLSLAATLSGLVSSAGTTTSAVGRFRTRTIDAVVATTTVL